MLPLTRPYRKTLPWGKRKMNKHNNELIEVKKDISEIFIEVAENRIDTLADFHFVTELPVLKTICTVAKGIVGILNQYQIRMIEQFIYTVNSGIASSGEIHVHIENLRADRKKLEKEVNYILVKISAWTDIKKSEYFGKLYIAYISKRIPWEELTLYTDILGQITLFDLTTLEELYKIGRYDTHSNPPFASMLRLQSLGLAVFHDGYVRQTSRNSNSGQVKEERGRITNEGKMFYRLITSSRII